MPFANGCEKFPLTLEVELVCEDEEMSVFVGDVDITEEVKKQIEPSDFESLMSTFYYGPNPDSAYESAGDR